jgi:DNA repair exonuclease SbcCD ATPase subunit
LKAWDEIKSRYIQNEQSKSKRKELTMAFSYEKVEDVKQLLDSLKRQADADIRNAEVRKRQADDKLTELLEKINKLEEENKRLEEENTKLKAQRATKTKTTKKYDLYEIPQDEELEEILEDHIPPVKGWVQGNLGTEYLNIEVRFTTLKKAHDYYLETLKEKLEVGNVKYGGILKATSGYYLKPNTHWAKFQTYKPSASAPAPAPASIKLKEWVYWEFDETCLE